LEDNIKTAVREMALRILTECAKWLRDGFRDELL
jgi:hypothetical protein